MMEHPSVLDHLDWVAGEIDPDHVVVQDDVIVRDERCDWAASALIGGLHYYVGLSVNGFPSPKDGSYGRRYWVFRECPLEHNHAEHSCGKKKFSSLSFSEALDYLAKQASKEGR